MKRIIFLLTLLLPLQALAETSFSGWMNEKDLNAYFNILNNNDQNSSIFDQGKILSAVEGRWHNNTQEYRVKITDSPDNTQYTWYWWINQQQSAFLQKIKQYEASRFKLISAQSFTMPDGSSRYQGIWYREQWKPREE